MPSKFHLEDAKLPGFLRTPDAYVQKARPRAREEAGPTARVVRGYAVEHQRRQDHESTRTRDLKFLNRGANFGGWEGGLGNSHGQRLNLDAEQMAHVSASPNFKASDARSGAHSEGEENIVREVFDSHGSRTDSAPGFAARAVDVVQHVKNTSRLSKFASRVPTAGAAVAFRHVRRHLLIPREGRHRRQAEAFANQPANPRQSVEIWSR